MEEVGDLTHSPPLVRRVRSRRTNQMPQTTEAPTTQRATRAARSVIDDLEWSAPSSPVSEGSKPASEASAGGSLDPSLWQDFGSAFHTAFSLLGGSEGMSDDPHTPAAREISSPHSNVTLSPAQQSSSDCVIIDSDLDQIPDITPGQCDDAPEKEEKKDDKNAGGYSSISDTEGYDSDALYCICRQKHSKRFMICCDSCQEWFHGDCVGISETLGHKMEKKGQEYICPPCTTKKQLQSEPQPQPDPPGEEGVEHEDQQALKVRISFGLLVFSRWLTALSHNKIKMVFKPFASAASCSKQALPDSVYCGTDCILQHAAVTMKTLSDPKVSKSRGRGQRKSATARPLTRTLAVSLQFNISQAGSEAVTPETQSPEDTSRDDAPSSEPVTETAPPQTDSTKKAKEPENSGVSKQQSAESDPAITPTPAKSSLSPAAQSPSNSAPRHHETGALMVAKTTYVIPKKQSGSQSPSSSHLSASVSCQKPSSAPTLLNETRNLLVPPAPSAPSSRPSQPNNQVRQSIQRTLISILSKRVCDCEDLEMSESEAAKLVASIEMEMFDVFRNTDSKYMNKYRTIMFNLKDPRNKGLLYRVVRGEISPFRLVRMSQKDMQAIKAPEPSAKETEVASQEQKKSFPAPALKTRTYQPSKGSTTPDILTCMLKDTTSEHKAHLFDLKCKICTGDDSPLQAPPDSHDMDSLTSSLLDPPSRLLIDSPARTIVESPASPTMDSPASPTLESPASPVMECVASPNPDNPKVATSKRAYTPVVIPTVSTVTITRHDPRTAANRFSALFSSTSGPSNTTHNQSDPYAPLKEASSAPPSAPASSLPPVKTIPKSILMKPSSSADPRLYCTSARTMISESPADGETAQFLAKQDTVWKGFLNMLTVAKFVTKGYLVSGSAENLKADLPDTIQIGGRIMPETVWDYVAKLKTSITKELCVIRFHPATEEEEVAYVSLFSYFSSRGRFGVVANNSRSIKDVYLVPLSATESIPSILQPLEGPGLEKNRPNLLLGLAIIQKVKRPGSFPQEIEEKRPNVHMSKDPMWIPKPPVLYGSDKLEIFQPYDPETPASTTPPGSPSCPGSPSDSSSSGSVTIPSLLTSIRATPPVSTSAVATTTQSTSNSISDNNTPLQTILRTLFGNKQTDSTVASDQSSTTTTTISDKKIPVSQVSGSMVDPIVQQYGQKSKVKEIEEEENEFDRPYDPEEEYDPAMGYGMIAPQNTEKIKADGPVLSGFVDDDVAYDPEDETIFEDIQIMPNIPTGTVVVSAATLTEQQRMLEELNKQIEEQKRQLKEQEEALRQQKEAVGMFMARFSVSDSLMSPPSNSLALSQMSSLQGGIMQIESGSSESTEKTSIPTATLDKANEDSQPVELEDTTTISNFKNDTDTATEQDETQENVKESDKYSSAGEIEDSDVAYDPEDESLFNEIQEDVFQGGNITTHESSLSRPGHSVSCKGSPSSCHNRKRRLSPKRRGHHERGRHRSPSRRSQRRSPSHSRRRRERDRNRKGERDRSRHRGRDESERQSRHRKEHATRRHSHGHRRSSSSPRKKDSVPLSSKQHRGPSPQILEKSKHASVLCSAPDPIIGQFVESNTSPSTPVNIKNDPDEHLLKCNIVECSDKDLSPCSQKRLDSVKLEISEPPESHELQKNSVSDHDGGDGSFKQLDKPSQETFLNNKIESTVPLREIDPPIRDSPQSPDPEPPFIKPINREKIDPVNTEEIRDPKTHPNVSVPFVKIENNCLSIGEQETVSNIPWATVGSLLPDVRKSDFISLNQQGPVFRDQGVIEADKQRKGESSVLKHPEMMGEGGRHPKSAAGLDVQGSEPEIDPVTKLPGPIMSGTGIRNPGPDMKEPGFRGPQIDQRPAGFSFPGPEMRNSGIQGMSPNIWGPRPHIQSSGTGMHCSEPNMRDPGIQNLKTGRIGVEPVIRGSGMRNPLEHMESSSMQGMHLEVQGPVLDMRNNEPDIGGQKLISVTNFHMGESCLQSEMRDPVMKAPLLDRSGLDISGSGPRGPLLTMYHSNPDISGLTVVDERKSQEDKDHWKRGFQPHGRNSNFSEVGTGRERSLESNAPTGLEARPLSSVTTDEGQDPQRGVPIRGPRPNTNYESGKFNRPCIEQEIGGSREHFRQPQTDTGAERSVQGPGMRGSETMHELRWPDMTGRSYMGLGQDMDSMDDSNTRGDRSELNTRASGKDIGDTGLCSGDANIRVRTTPGPGLFRRNEQMGQEDRGPMPNITNLDWRSPGVGHDMCGQRGSGPVRGKPFIQNEWSDNQPERRGPNIESQGPDRGPGGSDFLPLGPQRGGPDMDVPKYEWTGSGGPVFKRPENEQSVSMDNSGPGMRGPGVERRGQAVEGPVTNRVGPGASPFRGPGPDRKGPVMEGQGPDMRVSAGPDFRASWPERRGLEMVDPGPDRRERDGPDFREPGPKSRGISLEGPGSDRRGPGGSGFRGSRPDRRNLSMESPGSDRRGPGGPDFWGSGPGSRDLPMEGPGHNSRGSGGQVFRGPAPELRHPTMGAVGPDRRGPGVHDFSGPGPDRRGGLGPNRRESGVPDFSGPGYEMRGPSMGNQECDKRGPGGLEFRVPGPDRRGSGCSDLRGPGGERSGPSVDDQGPRKRGLGDQNASGLCPDRRGPHMGVPGPDCIGMGPERIAQDMEGPGPHNRGQGAPHFRGPGPESRYPNIEGPGPDREPLLETPCSYVEGLGPNRRGPGGPNTRRPNGPNFMGPGPERRLPDMEGPGIEQRGPPFRGMGPDQTVMEVQAKGPTGPDFRGPICESRDPDTEGPRPSRQESRGTNFREPGPERRVTDMEGPGPDWRRSVGPDFKGPGIRHKGQNAEDLRNDKRGDWGGADFGGSEPFQESLDTECPRPDRTDKNLRRPWPMRINSRGPRPEMNNQGDRWKSSDTEEQWSDRSGPNMVAVGNERECSGDHWKRRGSRAPRPNQEGPDEQGQEHSRQGPHSEWRGPGIRGPGPIQERPNMLLPAHMRGPGDHLKGLRCRGPGPVQHEPDMVSPGPRNEWTEPDRAGVGPHRRGPGPFFRGERNPDNRGQGHDRRGLDIRGSNKRGGPDTGNDWQQPDCRGNVRGPNMEGPGTRMACPDLINSCPNGRGFEMEGLDRKGPGGSDSGCPGPGMMGPHLVSRGSEPAIKNGLQGSDVRGQGHVNRVPDMRNREPGQRGQTINNERRGPELTYSDKSASPNLSSPHQVTRFKFSGDPHSEPFNKLPGPPPNSGGNSFPGFDNPQNRQAVKPQRHRAALLPTPTEGLIQFPNRTMGHSTDREWRRGRPVSRGRGLVKGQRQQQEKRLAGKMNMPLDASTGSEEKM
uniref:Death inducer-obliterator 1 n=1 Tax=Monopterus albus TaxID=43700 RepID=A0A3Q3KQE4_MONAL